MSAEFVIRRASERFAVSALVVLALTGMDPFTETDLSNDDPSLCDRGEAVGSVLGGLLKRHAGELCGGIVGVIGLTLLAVVAGANAVGGDLVVLASNLAVGWFQAREARNAQMQNALMAFGGIVSQIDHVLRVESEAARTTGIVTVQISKRWPHFRHGIGLPRRRSLEAELDACAIEINKTMTAAALLAPANLLPCMNALTGLMDSVRDRDQRWQQNWNTARTTYFLACRELFGSGAPRADSRSIGNFKDVLNRTAHVPSGEGAHARPRSRAACGPAGRGACATDLNEINRCTCHGPIE